MGQCTWVARAGRQGWLYIDVLKLFLRMRGGPLEYWVYMGMGMCCTSQPMNP